MLDEKALDFCYLATALGYLRPKELNALLTNTENRVLEYLVKTAQKDLIWALFNLAYMLTDLDPKNLNTSLTNTKNGVLNSLRKST
jgi:hypothetical protein